MAPDTKVEILGEVGEAGHARGRLIAVATVLTTLAAAATGYMQASALRAHDEADVRAERLAAIASKVAAVNRDEALIQLERVKSVQQAEDQARRAQADQGSRGAGAPIEAERWQAVAELFARDSVAIARGQRLDVFCSWQTGNCRHEGLLAICSSNLLATARHCRKAFSNSVEHEHYPVDYEQAVQHETYRLHYEREVANAEAESAESRFAQLAAALTMLTVAVFLFGYSLTPQGRERRRLFVTCATLFLLAGSGWSVYYSLRGNTTAPTAAAAAFADGEVAFNEGNLGRAVKRLKSAVELWGGSSRAYSELADAEYVRSEPHSESSGALYIPGVDVLKENVSDEERALSDGSQSPLVRADLGADLLFLGLLKPSDAQISRSRELSKEAAARFAEQLTEEKRPGQFAISALFTVAEADLALGLSQAPADYCVAVRHLIKRPGKVPLEDVYEAANTDVRLIEQTRPQRRREARALIDGVRAATSRKTAPKCHNPLRRSASGAFAFD